ncbi:hypothetical protein CK216_04925 [Mesorhizobium sp. WSM3876]|nr:hypothetical protein CK216_04925 [Mesorhizobium sp. WSM3876]
MPVLRRLLRLLSEPPPDAAGAEGFRGFLQGERVGARRAGSRQIVSASLAILSHVGAAPHLPAGIFSPLNGEKGLTATPAPLLRLQTPATGRRLFSPRHYTVTTRGEMPGRAMRRGAGVWSLFENQAWDALEESRSR